MTYMSEPVLCFPVPDVVVWVQAVSEGQYPAVHLQPEDTVALREPEDGQSAASHFFL